MGHFRHESAVKANLAPSQAFSVSSRVVPCSTLGLQQEGHQQSRLWTLDQNHEQK